MCRWPHSHHCLPVDGRCCCDGHIFKESALAAPFSHLPSCCLTRVLRRLSLQTSRCSSISGRRTRFWPSKPLQRSQPRKITSSCTFRRWLSCGSLQVFFESDPATRIHRRHGLRSRSPALSLCGICTSMHRRTVSCFNPSVTQAGPTFHPMCC